jgi:hypothetical protein
MIPEEMVRRDGLQKGLYLELWLRVYLELW